MYIYIYDLYITCFPKSLTLTALLMNDRDEAKPCHPARVNVPLTYASALKVMTSSCYVSVHRDTSPIC